MLRIVIKISSERVGNKLRLRVTRYEVLFSGTFGAKCTIFISDVRAWLGSFNLHAQFTFYNALEKPMNV